MGNSLFSAVSLELDRSATALRDQLRMCCRMAVRFRAVVASFVSLRVTCPRQMLRHCSILVRSEASAICTRCDQSPVIRKWQNRDPTRPHATPRDPARIALASERPSNLLDNYYSSRRFVSRNFASRLVIAGATLGPMKLPQPRSG